MCMNLYDNARRYVDGNWASAENKGPINAVWSGKTALAGKAGRLTALTRISVSHS